MVKKISIVRGFSIFGFVNIKIKTQKERESKLSVLVLNNLFIINIIQLIKRALGIILALLF